MRYPTRYPIALLASLLLAAAIFAVGVYSYLFPALSTSPTYRGVPLKQTLAITEGNLVYVTDSEFLDDFGDYTYRDFLGVFSVVTCHHYLDGTSSAYRISLVTPLLACLVYPAVWLTGWSRRRFLSRLHRGVCVKCGYNLTGNRSGVCPECGAPAPHAKMADPTPGK